MAYISEVLLHVFTPEHLFDSFSYFAGSDLRYKTFDRQIKRDSFHILNYHTADKVVQINPISTSYYIKKLLIHEYISYNSLII